MKNKLKTAYTLAEVVIVMLIIAVVVGVSIKLTKAKLDNITSYTYYTAYNTVRAVAGEMLRDFDAEQENYAVTFNKFFLPVYDYVASLNRFFQPAYGVYVPCPANCTPKMDNRACWQGDYSKERCCDCPTKDDEFKDKIYCLNGNSIDPNTCPSGWSVDSKTCTCKAPMPSLPDPTPNPTPDPDPTPTPDPDPTPEPDPDPTPTPEPENTCPAVTPCGQECNAATGFVLRDIAGFSRTCPDRDKQWNEETCGCVPTPQTVSRSGEGFCKLFVNYTNTSQLEEDDECNGDAISNDEIEFADKNPDMILRNGMILYNVSQNPTRIAELAGNSKGVTFMDGETEIDVDEWGYKLYIDIDGARGGEGRLWEDVYPFYVTLSGTVIPAYDSANPELSGGDSKMHLQTSVYDEFVDGNGRHTQWITKSRTFKDSACTMGYVNPATPYCRGVAVNNQCAQENHDCRLKTVMPVKFFGY